MKLYRPLLGMAAVFLTACAGLGSQPKGIPVNIQGVNHTDRPFQFALVDPNNPDNNAGGEHIGPFGGGGIRCCYMLPKQWAPGMQVQVRATHWEKMQADGKLPEIKQVFTVEVPRYVDGDPGELWILRTKEGGIELVLSNVEPGHPEWPGKLKGWPVPSIEFQRERWEIYRKSAAHNIQVYRQLISELRDEPEKHLLKTWNYEKEYSRDRIKSFTGPNDPAFAAYLSKDYAEGLSRNEAKLTNLLKEKP